MRDGWTSQVVKGGLCEKHQISQIIGGDYWGSELLSNCTKSQTYFWIQEYQKDGMGWDGMGQAECFPWTDIDQALLCQKIHHGLCHSFPGIINIHYYTYKGEQLKLREQMYPSSKINYHSMIISLLSWEAKILLFHKQTGGLSPNILTQPQSLHIYQ